MFRCSAALGGYYIWPESIWSMLGKNFRYLIQYKTECVCALNFCRMVWCWAYKLCMMRSTTKIMLADSQKSSSPVKAAAAAVRCSNKLTIFTAHIKELVNFQRKCVCVCVSAIYTKTSASEGSEGVIRCARFRIHFISFSFFLRSRILCGKFVCVVPWRCATSKWSRCSFSSLVLRIIAL